MGSRVNYTAVGLFVVLLGLGIAAASYWIATGGNHAVFIRYVIYATDSVSGLNVNSKVLYRGVDVGKVSSIRIDPSDPQRIRVMVDIDATVPIRTDTVAQLRPLGVTGLSVMNLTGGSSDIALHAHNGDKYPVIPYEPSVFSRLEGGLNETLVTVTKLGKQLEKVLSDRNITAASNSLKNIESLTHALVEHRSDIEQTLVALRETSQNVSQLTAGGKHLMAHGNQVLDSLDHSVKGLGKTLDMVNRAANRVAKAGDTTVTFTQAGTQAVQRLSEQTLPDFNVLLVELQGLSQSLTGLVDNLRSNPSQLLYGRQPAPPGPGEEGASSGQHARAAETPSAGKAPAEQPLPQGE